MKDRPVLRLWIAILSAALFLVAVAGCCRIMSRGDKSGCNPHLAHVEIHGGPEITIELERDRSSEVETESPKDPETGQEVADFDRMV